MCDVWPEIFELSVGESHGLETANGVREVRVLSIDESTEPDYWSQKNPTRRILSRAHVRVDVSGQTGILVARPFQMPKVVNGLRLYVEATHRWGTECGIAPLRACIKDVRISAAPEECDWGPGDLVFPLAQYRWRSSSYNNTWSAFVPAPDRPFYYHRGEDFGALPDELDVRSVGDGIVTCSPVSAVDHVPSGAPASPMARANGIEVRLASGIYVDYCHMNMETIDPGVVVGSAVRAGQVLAKSGSTWDGARSMQRDPHLHVGFHLSSEASSISTMNETDAFSPYPFLVQAYLRTYPDPILPVAGGYAFAEPGEPVELDGRFSIARPGRGIAGYSWHLHDGSIVEGPACSTSAWRPGLYSEELRLVADNGTEDRDYVQLRIYDPGLDQPDILSMPFGWVHHMPVRGAGPDEEIVFSCQLANVAGARTIDFGDGSAQEDIADVARHAYSGPGCYTVTVKGEGMSAQVVCIKTRVVIENPTVLQG